MRGCVRTHSLIHTFLTYTHTIYSQYDPRELVRLNGGKPALTMQAFTSLCDRAGDPPAPAPDPPATLPSVGDGEGAGEGESRGEGGGGGGGGWGRGGVWSRVCVVCGW